MKILLVSSGGKSIGLEYIFSYLKQRGHTVDFIYDPTMFYIPQEKKGRFALHNRYCYSPIIIEPLIREILKSQPDLIGFSVFSDTYGFACRIAKAVKKVLNVPIIFGGYHPSSVPEIVLAEDYIDYVCVGEGEEAMEELVTVLKDGGDTTAIPNIWTKQEGQLIKNPPRPLIKDLDVLPFPGDICSYKRYSQFIDAYLIITSRGCPFDCTFCYNHLEHRMYRGKEGSFRRRSVDNVMEELKLVKKQNKGIKNIWFGDAIFTYDTKWLKEFCLKYKREIGLPYMCFSYAPYISSEVMELLESSNCVIVELGIQTVSEEIRKEILKRYDTNQQIIAAINLFQSSKVSLVVNILLNVPGQDEQELVNTARFFSQYPPDSISLLPLRYYPRTDIIEKAREKGILSQEDVKKIEHSKEYTPFGVGHILSSKQMIENNKIYRDRKLANLVGISYTIPFFLMNIVLKNKLYLYLLLMLNVYAILIQVGRSLVKRKRKFKFFNFWREIRFYFWRHRARFPHIMANIEDRKE